MRTYLYLAVALSLVGSGLAQNAEPAQHSTHAAASHAKPSADKVWAELMDGNKRFVAGKPRTYDVVALRRKLAEKQSPNVIILSCSDSRVSPELSFDQSVGDLNPAASGQN
jgi:hypothetical protein